MAKNYTDTPTLVIKGDNNLIGLQLRMFSYPLFSFSSRTLSECSLDRLSRQYLANSD